MIRTLLVILVPVVLITWFFSRDIGDYQVQEVDWRPVLAQAREQSPYPVLAPADPPEGWRPTVVSWVPTGEPYLNDQPSARNLWRLGFLTPDNIAISVNQGDIQPERFVADVTRDGFADGQSTIDGQTWVRYVSPDERTRSLVLTAPKVTTVVVGDTSYEGLEAFAGSLRAT